MESALFLPTPPANGGISNDEESHLLDFEDKNDTEPQIFESQKPDEDSGEKEQEMFEEKNLEEDFEIPAFLRRQKN